jgi:hypothetical protein
MLPICQKAKALWSEDEISDFVHFMALNPLEGDVMPGTKGLRKIRWSRAGMGKRGGARVVHFCAKQPGRSHVDRGLRQGHDRQFTRFFF